MKLSQQRLALGVLSLATVLASSTAMAEASPLQVRVQRTIPVQQRIVSPQPTSPVVPHVTQVAPQIPPRPDMCVPDYSWFDYDNWEWVCVGHL